MYDTTVACHSNNNIICGTTVVISQKTHVEHMTMDQRQQELTQSYLHENFGLEEVDEMPPCIACYTA